LANVAHRLQQVVVVSSRTVRFFGKPNRFERMANRNALQSSLGPVLKICARSYLYGLSKVREVSFKFIPRLLLVITELLLVVASRRKASVKALL